MKAATEWIQVEVTSGTTPVALITEMQKQGWEFVQIYVVIGTVPSIRNGTEIGSIVFVLFKKECQAKR